MTAREYYIKKFGEEPKTDTEKVMPAIAFIKRFISIQGKTGTDKIKKAKKLLNDINKFNFTDNNGINTKYAKEIIYIKRHLEKDLTK